MLKKIFNQLNIEKKLFVYMVVTTGIIMAAITVFGFYHTKGMVEDNLAQQANYITTIIANKVNDAFAALAGDVNDTAYIIETVNINEDNAQKFLKLLLEAQKQIVGVTLRLSDETSEQSGKEIFLYAYNSEEEIKIIDLNKEKPPPSYQVTETEGWKFIRDADNDSSNKLTADIYTVSLYKEVGDKVFRGYLSIHTFPDWITVITRKLLTPQVSHLFYMSQDGYIYHIRADGNDPKYSVENFSIKLDEARKADKEFDKAIKNMLQGEDDIKLVNDPVTGEKTWIAYAPLAGKWHICLFFPQAELSQIAYKAALKFLLVGLIGFLLLLPFLRLIARSFARPLSRLNAVSLQLACGNMDVQAAEFSGNDEIAQLSTSFNIMVKKLRDYIDYTKKTTAERERVAGQLEVAEKIQASLLPVNFNDFYFDGKIELSAFLKPAWEVGGDFYDFIKLDERNLCFILGDVSGKGIPASLFMTQAFSFMRVLSADLREPGAILSRVNQLLADGNNACMFATVFCCVLDVVSGRLRYANAGHIPPLIIKNNGVSEFLPSMKNPPVGGFWQTGPYAESEIILKSGEAIILYTDGVTEAKNQQSDFFGAKLLQITVNECQNKESSAQTLRCIYDAVEKFAGECEQSDDIAMLMVKYNG